MKILLCTIVRDRSQFSLMWASQIVMLAKLLPECTFSISVYENDSKDNSAQKFKTVCMEYFRKSSLIDKIYFQSESLYTDYHDSETADTEQKIKTRLRNLANARNKCLNNAFDDREATYYDKIVFIEPDVFYSPDSAARALKKSKSCDILSGYSCLFPSHDLYDSWATRLNVELLPLNRRGIQKFNQHRLDMIEYLNKSKESMIKMSSTFSGFCIYSPSIFAENIDFTFVRDGVYDCDTTLFCYSALDAGYEQIYMYKDFIIYHYK